MSDFAPDGFGLDFLNDPSLYSGDTLDTDSWLFTNDTLGDMIPSAPLSGLSSNIGELSHHPTLLPDTVTWSDNLSLGDSTAGRAEEYGMAHILSLMAKIF